MKTLLQLFAGLMVVSAGLLQAQAVQSERLLSFTMSGFYQGTTIGGAEQAIPFRLNTRDILDEISLTTGQDFSRGLLLIIEDLDSETPMKIVARNGANQLDVTAYFEIEQGPDVRTTRYLASNFASATFYAIDKFLFSTINGEEGLYLNFQGLTKESQRTGRATINRVRYEVVTSIFCTDGVAELDAGSGFIGPIKGTIRTLAEKFVLVSP
ncbi:MAG: hypothetical protein ABJC04_00885 [Verrucomicrobiota bacterium]